MDQGRALSQASFSYRQRAACWAGFLSPALRATPDGGHNPCNSPLWACGSGPPKSGLNCSLCGQAVTGDPPRGTGYRGARPCGRDTQAGHVSDLARRPYFCLQELFQMGLFRSANHLSVIVEHSLELPILWPSGSDHTQFMNGRDQVSGHRVSCGPLSPPGPRGKLGIATLKRRGVICWRPSFAR